MSIGPFESPPTSLVFVSDFVKEKRSFSNFIYRITDVTI